jgi:DNA-binding response OmpR family regulator
MTSEQIEKRQHGLSSYTKDFKRSDGRVVSLTKRQYEYLNFFTTKPNQIVTAEEIINHVGEGKGKNDKWDGSVHAIVLSIRNKIEVDPRKPQILITYRGLGYKFVYPTEDKNLKQV